METCGDIWLSTSQVAELEEITDRTVRKYISQGKLNIRTVQTKSRGGKSGESYEIHLDSLTPAARKRYYDKYAADKEPEQQEEDAPDEGDAPPPNLAELKAFVGAKKFEKMMEQANRKANIVKEYLKLKSECGWGKTGDVAKSVAEKYGMSDKNLYRMVERYQKYGTAGLLRKCRKLGQGTTRYSISKEIDFYFRKHWLRENQPTVGDVLTKMKKFCQRNSIEMPSQASIYRLKDDILKYEPDLVCLGREGQEAYIKVFGEKAVRQEPKFVNQIWEGDHHRLDFFGLYAGKPVRFWLTAWEDVTTRVISGITISAQANGRTIGLSLRHGILTKTLPTWDADISPAMRAALDNMEWDVEDLNQVAAEASIPWSGLPMALYIDNGEDYKAKLKKGLKCEGWDYTVEVKSMCELLNIETMFCTPYSPYAKGHLERWFGTLCGKFSKNMPGYCGKDNKKRPESLDEKHLAEQGKLLTMEEIIFLLQHYLWEYHNEVHSSLGMTPLQKYEQTMKARSEMPDPRTMDIALMDYETASVTRSGIQRFGSKGKKRWYKDADGEILKYAGQDVVIRFDPNNIGELLAFDIRTGNYICTVTNKHYMDWGASQDDVKEFKKRSATQRKAVRERLNSYQDNTLESIISKRLESGEARMITGETKQTQSNVQMVTGMERAAKQREKVVALKNSKKKSGSIFDEYIKNASQM